MFAISHIQNPHFLAIANGDRRKRHKKTAKKEMSENEEMAGDVEVEYLTRMT